MPRSVCSTHEATWQIIRKHPCSLASLSDRALTSWANLLAIGGRRGAALPGQSIWPAFRKMPTTTRLSGGSGQSSRMPPLELAVGRQCGGVSLYQLPGGGALLKQSLPGNAEKKPGAAAPRVATSICVRNPGGFPKGERQSGPDPRNPPVPPRVVLQSDRTVLWADGKDLCLVRVRIEGREGNLISTADDLVQFQLEGEGKVVRVNNGLQTSHEPFREAYRKGFSGVWLTAAFAMKRPRRTVLMATAEGPSRATSVQVRARTDCRLCIARGVPALHVGRRGLKRGGSQSLAAWPAAGEVPIGAATAELAGASPPQQEQWLLAATRVRSHPSIWRISATVSLSVGQENQLRPVTSLQNAW